METLLNIDWKSVFVPTVSVLEIMFRGSVIYLALFALMPFGLKREAETFVQKAANIAASNKDANDILYSLESSADYNPQHLERIKAKLFALNFADDEFNPVELNVLPEAVKRVKNGNFLTVPASPNTHGHASQMHPQLWSAKVAEFLARLAKLEVTSHTRTLPNSFGKRY